MELIARMAKHAIQFHQVQHYIQLMFSVHAHIYSLIHTCMHTHTQHTDNYQHRADVRKELTVDKNWNECLSKIRPMFISQVVHNLKFGSKRNISLHHFNYSRRILF